MVESELIDISDMRLASPFSYGIFFPSLYFLKNRQKNEFYMNYDISLCKRVYVREVGRRGWIFFHRAVFFPFVIRVYMLSQTLNRRTTRVSKRSTKKNHSKSTTRRDTSKSKAKEERVTQYFIKHSLISVYKCKIYFTYNPLATLSSLLRLRLSHIRGMWCVFWLALTLLTLTYNKFCALLLN